MIEDEKVLATLQSLNKEEILSIVKKKLLFLPTPCKYHFFGDIYFEKVIMVMDFKEVMAQIKIFEGKCMALEYYDDSPLNTSADYDKITPLAEKWGYEMSCWLNRASSYAIETQYKKALECFNVLIPLVEKSEECEIVYHHNGGEYLLDTLHDYEELYKQAKAK